MGIIDVPGALQYGVKFPERILRIPPDCVQKIVLRKQTVFRESWNMSPEH